MKAKAGKIGDYAFSALRDRERGDVKLTLSKNGIPVFETECCSFTNALSEAEKFVARKRNSLL